MTIRIVGIVVATVALAACGSSSKRADETASTTTIASSVTAPTAIGTAPTSSQPSTGSSAAPATEPAGTTLAVTSIEAPGVYTCSDAPNVQSPNQIRLKWTTTGAASVTVSIDDPNGKYQAGLPTAGSLDLPAPCAGETQTYYVIAIAPDGTKTTKSTVTQGR